MGSQIRRRTQEAEEICLENREVGAEPARGFESYRLRQRSRRLGKKRERKELSVYSCPTVRVDFFPKMENYSR